MSEPANTSEDLLSNLSFILTALTAIGIFYVLFGEKQPAKAGRPLSEDSKETFILLLGVDEQLFKACFGGDDQWLPCKIKSLAEYCPASGLQSILYHEGPISIVIQEDVEHPHWNLIQSYYAKGGFVAYFGIYGEFAAPTRLSQELGLDWKFSGYTKHPYVLTSTAKDRLGDAIAKQPYTKANLLWVPEQDRMMVPEADALKQYLEEEGPDPEDYDGGEEDVEYKQELVEATQRHTQRCLLSKRECPLALHRNAAGGKVAYIGFVNGDGNIPAIVRALLTEQKTK